MIKKAALGLTLALTMSTAVACGPNGDQGMNNVDSNTYGTTNYGASPKYYQDGTVNRNWQGNRTGSVGDGYRIGNQDSQGYRSDFRSTVNNQRGYGTLNGYRDGRIYGTQDGFLDGYRDRRGIFGNYNRNRTGMFGAGYDTGQNRMDDWGYNRGWGQGLGRQIGSNQGTNSFMGYDFAGYGNNGNQVGIYDESTSRKVEQRLNKLAGVTNSHVLVTDRAVFVGVDTDDTKGLSSRNNGLVQKIRAEVQAEAGGKQIIIFTDQGQVTMNNQKQNQVGKQNKTGTMGTTSKNRTR